MRERGSAGKLQSKAAVPAGVRPQPGPQRALGINCTTEWVLSAPKGLPLCPCVVGYWLRADFGVRDVTWG